uniref:Isocitrate dehydrogenase (NADP(+)) n=1 Tax=Oxyrrhis marina TaxID=2969 RepID=A0A7S4GMN2_OXYMA
MAPNGEICWTYTDEAPMLATYSLYPIVKGFTRSSGVDLSMKDISVAGRVLAAFPEKMSEKMPDELAALGELTKTPDANIIKLPNVSASIPQLKECIQELQAAGFELPSYPENPKTDEEKGVQARYAKILGSAVNPVLREGNSDRRAAVPVKNYAKKYPHKMGPWSGTSKSHVAHMTEGDFYANEQSVVLEKATSVRIEFESCDGNKSVLKKDLKLEAAEVLDGTFMSKKALRAYYEREMEDCKKQGILLSLHLKATMMKISDPIIFGHAVTVFFKDVFEKHAATLKQLGAEPNEGFGAVLKKISTLPESEQQEILADIDAAYAARPKLAMVDSNRGITNLHVPSDIIVDASMPSMIRGMDGLGGGMWCPDSSPGAKDSHLCDTKGAGCAQRDHRILQSERGVRSGYDGLRPERWSDGQEG